MQAVEPPQADASNCRTGTDTPPTEKIDVRGIPELAVAVSVTTAGPVPCELPETVSQEGKPVIDQAQPLSVWIASAMVPPAAGTPRSAVLMA